MGRLATASSADSGSLHAGQRLAKPGLPGLSSNSSEQTTQTLMGNAICNYFNREFSFGLAAGMEKGGCEPHEETLGM